MHYKQSLKLPKQHYPLTRESSGEGEVVTMTHRFAVFQKKVESWMESSYCANDPINLHLLI